MILTVDYRRHGEFIRLQLDTAEDLLVPYFEEEVRLGDDHHQL